MITVGIDLAAEPVRTAAALIEWRPGGAVLRRCEAGLDDASLRALVAGADKVGVDCPVGWPDAFVDLVSAHREHRVVAPPDSGRSWRRPLTLRATDLEVHRRTGRTPLSVSADLIAHVALRWAAVAAQLEADGIDCRRDGRGRVVEVYPAASLSRWGLTSRGYKGPARQQALHGLVDALTGATSWLDLGELEPQLRNSDDRFDAVVAALSARDAWLSMSSDQLTEEELIPGELTAVALREGWVHLPARPLSELPGRSPEEVPGPVPEEVPG